MRHSLSLHFPLRVSVRAAALFALSCLGSPQDASGQAQFEGHHFTTSDSVRLHYLVAGSGPLLVFVPGWTMPAWIWEPQLDHFAATHHVVALDPRGQGQSDKLTEGYHAARS